jgi:putative peptidoglycan lipid II flippase
MAMSIKLTPIQHNTINIIIAIGIIKVAFFLRDVAFANFFGIERSTDVYFYSLILPTILFSLFSGSFNSFFIPTYLKIKTEQGADRGRDYASLLILCGVLIILLISLLCGWVIPPMMITIIHPGVISGVEMQTFLDFSKFTAWFFFFYLSSALLSSLLQAEHRYMYSFYPQLLTPLATIAFIFWGNKFYHIYSAVYGMLAGSAISFLILVVLTYRLNLVAYVFNKTNKLPAKELSVNIQQLLFLFITGVFPSLINVLDQYMAGSLGEGQLTVLNYGIRIPDGLSEMLGMGLGIAVFSHFSQWATEKRHEYLINATQRIIIYVTLTVIPLCFYLIFFAKPLVGFLFERGAFSSMATQKVSEVLGSYAFVIYFFVIGIIGTRLISALARNQLILIFGATNLIIKIILNVILIELLGLRGIPLATLGMYFVGIAIIYYLLHKEGLLIFTKSFSRKLIFAWACVIAVPICLLGIRSLLFSAGYFIQSAVGLLFTMGLAVMLVLFNQRSRLSYIKPI